MQYGINEKTEILDDSGSTKTVVKKFESGIVQKPIRERFEIRHRTDKSDLKTISRIAEDLLSDFSKLDAVIKLERTKTGEQEGYFNLVECYTLLKYD